MSDGLPELTPWQWIGAAIGAGLASFGIGRKVAPRVEPPKDPAVLAIEALQDMIERENADMRDILRNGFRDIAEAYREEQRETREKLGAQATQLALIGVGIGALVRRGEKDGCG